MTSICIIPPTELPVSIERARANMRIDGDYMDSFLRLWLEGVTTAAEDEIGQRLIRQTWEVREDAFPTVFYLPHPVLRVTSVAYLDVEGIEQVLQPAAYKLVPSRYQTRLAPARGASWPATSPEPHAVIVTVECGYGDTSEKVPANVQLYLLAKLVEQFDPVTRTERDTVQSLYIERLLDGCRTHS